MDIRMFLVAAIIAGLSTTHVTAQEGIDPDFSAEKMILLQMRKVADRHLANMPATIRSPDGKTISMSNNGWIRAVLFTGIMATYGATGDDRYLDALVKIGEENQWKPGQRPRNADDHCIGQVYAEIYLLKKDQRMIAGIRDTFEKMLAEPKRGHEDWWWCDSLFMAPPAFARIGVATGDAKFLDFMNRMWWDSTEFLYDKAEHLYFRDRNYFIQADGSGRREVNGSKIFWSRGNGWVMGGITRILQYMPKDYHDRWKYVDLLRAMAETLASLQPSDGLWRSSLFDPDLYPGGETSGTGLIAFAMAWGVNNGILDREKYIVVIQKAWKALNGCVDASGRLGWVQPVGHEPVRGITRDDTMDYGAGAFLLAGSEILKLSGR